MPVLVTLNNVVPYLQAILTSRREQHEMRQLEAFWRDARDVGRFPAATEAWRRVGELIEGFAQYEPNPQFCDPGRGLYDGHELMARVRETLAAVERETSS